MKIAVIGSRGYPYVYSGYETFVKELSERLIKKNISVTVYCHSSLFENKPKKINGIDLKYISGIQTKSFSQLSHSFLSILHACFFDYDIIFVVNAANGPFGILTKLLKKKTVINVDGLEWLRPKWKGIGGRYYKFAARMATIFYDQIINDADEMRKIYLELFGVDSKVIAYGPKEIVAKKSKILSKLGIKPLDYFLIVGRLIPDNNWDILVDGFKLSDSNKKLVIVGDNPFKNRFQLNLEKDKNSKIIFTGLIKDQSELCDLFKNSYTYLHGHEYGGTNPTLIEALSYGNAVLALNTVFNKEVLQNGKYGFFFNKDKESVKNLINYADSNEGIILNFKKNSKKALKIKYDWDFIVDEYILVFKSLKNKI
jgi:glycosyltransferase involved in cell wall biosynthesis